MIFNQTGGMPLNFTVKAYASELLLPATAKENTIAVITNTTITGWSFADDEPTAPYAGMVWFRVSSNFTNKFNALKKNELYVYPTEAKQYVDGAWVSKTASTFKDGKWVDWVVYLYQAPNEYEDLTGGWAFLNFNNRPSLGTISKSNSQILLTTNSTIVGGSAGAMIAKPIDLTPFSTIQMHVTTLDFSGNGFRHLIVKKERTMVTTDILAQAEPTAAGQTISLDISSITGPNYVGVVINAPSDGKYSLKIGFSMIKLLP